MTTTTIDGCEIYFEDTGDVVPLDPASTGSGEPLLLLHGGMGTGRDFRHVFDLPALSRRYRVITPDARGHGRSTNPSGAFTFRRCGLDVLALLDHLGIESTRAVGMSLGGKTLLHAATLAPSRVSRMVLVSATPRFPEATRDALRAFSAVERTSVHWEMMRAQHVHGDAQIEALWRLGASFAQDMTDMSFTPERLAAITARTLVVAGDRDPYYPVELAVELYRGIKDSQLYVVPNGGHGPMFLGEREAFVKRALAFFEE
jgi:pimeloyl-ACP methyl ester carboxylesterase